MFRSMYKGTLPPLKDPSAIQNDLNSINNNNSEIDENQTYEATSWNQYFDSMKDIYIEGRGTFRVYECGNNQQSTDTTTTGENKDKDEDNEDDECSHLFVFVHGGGYTSMSWALLSKLMKQQPLAKSFRIMAYDSRAHGDTKTVNDNDCSIGTLVGDLVELVNTYRKQDAYLSKLRVCLVGHSMGGAVVVKASKTGLVQDQVGVVVIDVVEGTAMSALPAMRSILAKRPASFPSVSDAIKWSINSGTLRNIESACISIPTQIHINSTTGKYQWVTNLAETEQYWSEWFTGLSKDFLESRVLKLLILAGSDRLDRELMIGQMQGKFQLALFPQCGHVIQEDNPKATSDVLIELTKRLPK